MDRDYHINVFFSAEDGGYIADIPDLKHCSALGKTQVVAVREVLKAKAAWLRSAKKSGVKIPKPRYRPMIYQIAS